MDLIKLRVVTAFNVYRVGQIIERMPSVARQMLASRWYGRRLVEEVVPVVVAPPPLTEPAPVEAGPTRKFKKRGNP